MFLSNFRVVVLVTLGVTCLIAYDNTFIGNTTMHQYNLNQNLNINAIKPGYKWRTRKNNTTQLKKKYTSYSESNIVYVITPTYKRVSQAPDLTRLAQTLMSASNIHWIVIEDSKLKTHFVTQLLSRMSFPWTHLYNTTSPHDAKLTLKGCTQRNAGLTYILKQNIQDGVFYFADDDNAYDIRVIDELRSTKKVGIVPTGNFPRTGISSPVVDKGRITGFVDPFPGDRKWPVDMASFAVNIAFWRSKGAPLCSANKKGRIETQFLEHMMINLTDLEPKANNCTEVLVWHTKTADVALKRGLVNRSKYKDTNIPTLIENTAYGTVMGRTLDKL